MKYMSSQSCGPAGQPCKKAPVKCFKTNVHTATKYAAYGVDSTRLHRTARIVRVPSREKKAKFHINLWTSKKNEGP
jgi:hypothetical protein